ncbi:MAG TPA: hypothetical protein DCR40_16205 [Prolixibacteraceae bacterium]|nr:hypothetical protein [Prolixibacteraceae bacterium]
MCFAYSFFGFSVASVVIVFFMFSFKMKITSIHYKKWNKRYPINTAKAIATAPTLKLKVEFTLQEFFISCPFLVIRFLSVFSILS